MGILHNVFRLAGGAPPDHSAAGVREWVTTKNQKRADGKISFEIVVSGRDTASAKLSLGGKSELPSLREQIVEFPGGQMRVTESYRVFKTE